MRNYWAALGAKIISDAVLINLAFCLGYMIKFRIMDISRVPVLSYSHAMVFITILWLIIFNLAGLYKSVPGKRKNYQSSLSVSLGIISSAVLTYFMAWYYYKEAFYAAAIIIYASLILLFLLNISRYLIWRSDAK